MNDLDFIEDTELRKRTEGSIEYSYALLEKSKNDEQSALYREETYRVIILYVVSAIEAILLYLYRVRGEKLVFLDYKFVQPLSPDYRHAKKVGLPVVVAVQEKMEKREHQIGLHDLVTFFKSKKLIKPRMVSDILELNDMRNTLHFGKTRTTDCDIKRVDDAFRLLAHTIELAPTLLQ